MGVTLLIICVVIYFFFYSLSGPKKENEKKRQAEEQKEKEGERGNLSKRNLCNEYGELEPSRILSKNDEICQVITMYGDYEEAYFKLQQLLMIAIENFRENYKYGNLVTNYYWTSYLDTVARILFNMGSCSAALGNPEEGETLIELSVNIAEKGSFLQNDLLKNGTEIIIRAYSNKWIILEKNPMDYMLENEPKTCRGKMDLLYNNL